MTTTSVCSQDTKLDNISDSERVGLSPEESKIAEADADPVYSDDEDEEWGNKPKKTRGPGDKGYQSIRQNKAGKQGPLTKK